MNNSHPLITIGMPCYNAKDTIIRALESACTQQWENFEIVLVDDCSGDGSIDVVKQYLRKVKDLSVKFVTNSTNKGPGYSRQRIIDLASGEFVVFFDDDDESHPNRIRKQYYAILEAEKVCSSSLFACYASGVRLYQSGYVKHLSAIGSKGMTLCGNLVADYLLYHEIRPDYFYGSGTPTCALMARKSTFKAAGGFDTKLRRVEDVEFAIRLSLMGGCFIGTKEELFKQYSTDAIDKSAKNNLIAEQMVVKKFKKYLDSKGLYEYAYRWPKLRYFHFCRQYLLLFKELIGLLMLYPYRASRHFVGTGVRRLIHEFLIIRGDK